MSSHLLKWTTCLVAALSLLGCGDRHFPEAAPESVHQDGPVLPELLESFAEPLQPMTETPMPSLAAAGSIELWVSPTGWAEYGQVRARARGSQITLPVGTTVLRVIREQGRITKYTALIKREAGFDPPADLWFAVYDPEGNPLQNPDGTAMQGKMPSCLGCHLSRAEDGYVFGRTDQ